MHTYSSAKAEILGVCNSALLLGSAAVIGYVPSVIWPNQEDRDIPEQDKFYIRCQLVNGDEGQAALAMCKDGARLFKTEGVVVFTIHTPNQAPDGSKKTDLLAELMRDAYRQARSTLGLYYRDERITPTHPEERFRRTNVSAAYYYTEVS